MKALAHVILHQLLFAVWLLAMWVLYCTPACTHPIEHLIAASAPPGPATGCGRHGSAC